MNKSTFIAVFFLQGAEAEADYRHLLSLQPDNYDYHFALRRILSLDPPPASLASSASLIANWYDLFLLSFFSVSLCLFFPLFDHVCRGINPVQAAGPLTMPFRFPARTCPFSFISIFS